MNQKNIKTVLLLTIILVQIMKKIIIALATFVVFGATQCTSSGEKEVKELDAVLMKGHDEVMPKSLRLGDIKSEVMAKAANADSATKAKAIALSTDLQKADDAMYKWMEEYGVAMNDITDNTKKMEVYKKLKTEIEEIKVATDNAIKAAEEFKKQ